MKEEAIKTAEEKITAFDFIAVTAKYLVIFLLIRALFLYVLGIIYIPSHSMDPTLGVGYVGIINRLAYNKETPKTDDIVVFTHKDVFEDGRTVIKRVIGTPGDRVEVKDGVLYLNGEPKDEPYLLENAGKDVSEMVVPEECYLLMGDNRNNSYDGRYWPTSKFVYEDEIYAKAMFFICAKPPFIKIV